LDILVNMISDFFVSKEQAQQRFNLCKVCEKFYNPTATCRECGCFMKLKVKIKNVACPLNKW